jgi:hypothetical protein
VVIQTNPNPARFADVSRLPGPYVPATWSFPEYTRQRESSESINYSI